MTRRAAAAAAAANMATSLRARPSRSSRRARDSSPDENQQDDSDGGYAGPADDSEGDSSPGANRKPTRISLRRSSAKRKADSDEEEQEEDECDGQTAASQKAAPAAGADEDAAEDSGGESSQVQVPVKRGPGRPPKRGPGRPPKHRNVVRLQRDAGLEDGADSDALTGDDTGNASAADAGDISMADMTLGADDVDGAGTRGYSVIGDEYDLDSDPQGDTKIDAKGNLQDGREFIFHTFTSPMRPDPEIRYCLSIDAAKMGGYRDSFYFYRNNPLLIKINCSDHEKDALIERGSLSGHLRNRVVTMVAVRNVYKLHGARIIKSGRAVTDDYYEELARKEGRKPGQLVDVMSDNAPVPARLTERRSEARREMRARERDNYRKPAETAASTYSHHAISDPLGNQIVTTYGDSGESPFERAKNWNTRRQNQLRAELNEVNWMMEMARSVRGMNSEILAGRTERLRGFPRPYLAVEDDSDEDEDEAQAGLEGSAAPRSKATKSSAGPPIGIYEALTNTPHYSVMTQPQIARLERVHERPLVNGASRDADSARLAVLGGAKVGLGGWGVASVEQRVTLPTARPGPDVRVPAAQATQDE